MAISPPSFQPVAGRTQAIGAHRAFVEPLLSAVLEACRTGTLDELLQRRPKATRWFARRMLPPVRAVGGDTFRDDSAHPAAWRVLLRAALARLRPDRAVGLDAIEPQDWTERPAWRPLLALLCQYDFLPVPQFSHTHRTRADGPAVEQLCGLWDVGPSTYYRYLSKGRRLLASVLFDAPAAAEHSLAREALLQHEVYALLQLDETPARAAWHARQATQALGARDGRAALWHLLRAGDAAGFIHCLKRFRVELASAGDTDTLVQQFAAEPIDWRLRFELCLAQAGLWRVRGVESAERQACEEALRLAARANDKLMLGIVYGELGKLDEARDADRAFTCYQESAEFLRQAGVSDEAGAASADVVEAYVATLVKLAWLYVLRNDPRSKAVLERADALRERCVHAIEVLAMLEQTWGEYWRRSGELPRALEHKHRALHIYERLGDQQSILKTYANLSLLYGDVNDFARAIDYSNRVLEMAQRFAVEPATVASTLQNLGATYFRQGKYDQAIEHYQRALVISEQANLRVLVGRAHYNLAEAYYRRFQALDQAEDERLGDAHTASALASWPDGDPAPAEATRSLKSEILGPRDNRFYDRLLAGELAAHHAEMSEVQRHRATLAVPQGVTEQIAAQLAIARSYLEISVKEREAAVALIDRHQMGERFAPELAALRETFDRQLSREERVSEQWRQATADLLPPARSAELLRHLLRAGSINKSGYSQLVGVGLATASKHLVKLAECCLLTQTGKGPSTRYCLPP